MGDPTEDQPKRRWWHRFYRLHVTTWVLLMILIACLVRINFVGLTTFATNMDPWFPDPLSLFGWPYEYHLHDTVNVSGINVFIIPLYQPIPNLINALVGILLCLIVGLLSELWMRTRKAKGLAQFRLYELLLLLIPISLGLSWWGYHTRLYTRESEFMELLEEKTRYDPSSIYSSEVAYGIGWTEPNETAPKWLIRLVGNEKYFLRFSHINLCEIYKHTILKDVGLKSFNGLKIMDTLYLGSSRINYRFFLNLSDERPYPGIMDVNSEEEIRSLVERNFNHEMEMPLGESDFLLLSNVNSLRHLILHDNLILIEDLKPLDQSDALKELDLDIMATEQELEAYKKSHPNLEVTWGETYPQEVVQKIRNVRAILDEMNSSNP